VIDLGASNSGAPHAPRNDFRGALRRGLVLLDAAMGTRLLESGLRLEDDDPCLWNLTHPDAVLTLHRRDAAAGAEAVVTNTFGANRQALARLGRGTDAEVAVINQAAVALARAALGPGGLVVGDLGPTALLFETHRLDQAEAALDQLDRAACVRVTVPRLVSLIAWPDDPGAAVARLVARGAEAVGANCQDGMAEALVLAERLREATALPLIVKPAAGRPGGPLDGPREFATAVSRLKALAPVLVGGCCGTTERHLAAVRSAWYDEPVPGG
jgi:5-methyltetrahydrofolate--homocysteine methyltransferase